MGSRILLVLCSLLLGFLPLIGQPPVRTEITKPAMGTSFRIVVYSKDSTGADAAISAAFRRIEQLEQIMSDYRSDSEINRLVSGVWQPVSADLYSVFTTARKLSVLTGGAFDVTIGPLSKLWRRAFRQQQFPSRRSIREAGSRVRWKWVRQKPDGTVLLRRDGMHIDLGGIAKGYALDAAGEVLRRAGYPIYLIDGGGDLLLGQRPPDRPEGWVVQMPTGRLDTANVAIATSGNAYHYLEHEGRRYGHLIDPRTGLGTIGNQGMVTVTGPAATVADALASASSVTGRAYVLTGYRTNLTSGGARR